MNQKTSHNKKLLFGLLGLLAAGLVIGGIAWWTTHQKTPIADRYIMGSVERGPIAQTVSANGTLNPVVLVSVGSQVSGIVKSLHADFNAHVKKGQILAELDPTLLRAQLTQSEATLASARASYLLAQENEKRSRDLYAKEFVTRQDLDTAVQAFEAAKAQVQLATAQVKHDRTNLNYTVIRSPVSGVVVSRVVDVGQTVAASFQTPTLFTIAKDLSQMQIDSSYAEADVGNIRDGQEANFTVDAFPDRQFHGVVRQVRLNPTTVQNVVTYDVVIGVNNADQVLMPGMTAYVNITVAQRKDALLVPNAALRFHPTVAERGEPPAGGAPRVRQKSEGGGQTSTVYIVENNQLKAVRIKTGITDNRKTEVLGGELRAGDKVVEMDRQSSGSGGAGGHRPRFF